MLRECFGVRETGVREAGIPETGGPTAGRTALRSSSAVTRSVTPFFVGVLLIAATVSWRNSVYYAGGLDSVVIAKAVLVMLALLLAWSARQRCAHPLPVGTRTMWLLVAYCAVSTFGAWSAGEVVPTFVLAFRVVLIATVLFLLVRTFVAEVLMSQLLVAMAVVGVLAAVTGIPNYQSRGRLWGGMPPVFPNELAFLCALPALGVMWLVLMGRGRTRHILVLAVLVGIVWLTGSRTGLFAMLAAMFVMTLQSRRLRPTMACALVFVFCAFTYLATATGVVSGFFIRDGGESVTSLNSRTIAWSAAFSFADTEWVRWMGAGLARKLIPVEGQYWDQQLLDSSWISALVQTGLVGALILLVWALLTGWASARMPRSDRTLYSALVVFLLVRSMLESGLLDSTPAFITFFLVSLLVHRPSVPTPVQAPISRRVAGARGHGTQSTPRWESSPVPSSASGS